MMDRLRDQLAALAEEVGDFARPPGVAVALRRVRRRRQRAVAVVVLSLLTPVIFMLSVSSPLERLGPATEPGQTGGLPTEAAGSRPYRGPLFGSVSPSKVVRGQSFTVRVWGCPRNFMVEISVTGHGPGLGTDTNIVDDPGGSFSDRVEVPPEATPGTYEVMMSCYASRHGDEEARRQLRITVLPS
jgi:hypothetical protein